MKENYPSKKIILDLKVNDFAKESLCKINIEEPVSPPACNPEEGPPLIFSQSIEDIASEVVDENRKSTNKVENNLKGEVCVDNIPKTVEFVEKSTFSCLIPATVSDISEDSIPPHLTKPPTLHMSGGMVSTDVTPLTASVPTSVITANTSIRNTTEKDEGFDSIITYLMNRSNGSPQVIKRDTLQVCGEKNALDLPSICNDLPLDLSITRVLPSSRNESATIKEASAISRKRQREDQSSEELEISIKKKSLGIPKIHKEADYISRKRSDINKPEENHVSLTHQNTIEGQKIPNGLEVIKIKNQSSQENQKNVQQINGNDIDCKLVLPKRKEVKAKIVFNNGMFVEIDRKLFNCLEQKLRKEKFEEKKKLTNKVQHSRQGNRKKETARRKEKQNELTKLATDIPSEIRTQTRERSQEAEEITTSKPKDMPMIIYNDTEDEKTPKENIIAKDTNSYQPSSRMTPPPTPPPSTSPCVLIPHPTTTSPAFQLPISPSSTPPLMTQSLSTPLTTTCSRTSPGLHKLPFIVSKPSYYSKTESRKAQKLK